MGRAIVREPQVFLMDEPLSNLDAKLRTQMRSEIAGLQRELGVTTMYVTHDQVEAMTMGTRIALMRDGVLQQEGPPQQLYDEPDNLFVAAFIGSPAMNLLQGRIERDAGSLHCMIGEQRLAVARTNGPTAALAAHAGTDVAVGIRPEHLIDPVAAPADWPRLHGRIKFAELLGAERLLQIELEAKPVVAVEVLEVARDADEAAASELLRESKSGRALAIARFDAHAGGDPGDLVELAVNTSRLQFFHLSTGRAIRD
jgi:multiple sugar transport system ATP-binding protein